MIFRIIFTGLVVISTFANAESIKPVSEYSGERLRALLEYYRGTSIAFRPARPTFLQGEEIALDYVVVCSPARKMPFSDAHFAEGIHVFRNGRPVAKKIVGPSSNFKPAGNAQNEFHGTFALSVGFGQIESDQEFGFRHLLPGHYEGYFDQGILSPHFEFDVLEVPDSLQSEWTTYCWIRSQHIKNSQSTSRQQLDSVLVLSGSLRPQGPWYVEGMSSALMLMGYNRSFWSESDSANIASLLADYASVDRVPAGYKLVTAKATLFADLRLSEEISALRQWGSEIGNSKLRRAIERYADERVQNEPRSNPK